LSNVLAHRLPYDISHPSSWLSFGGMASVVTKVHWHGWLILLPMWLTAPALMLIVAGLADARSDVRARITAAAYLAFFLVAGQSFDWYWGLTAWPTWALVVAGGPRAIAHAIRTIVDGRQHPVETASHGTR
jgi:Na+/proline symporter